MTPDTQAAARRVQAYADALDHERDTLADIKPFHVNGRIDERHGADGNTHVLYRSDLRELLAALDPAEQDHERPRAPYGHGQCPTCGDTFNLTKAGLMRHHSGDTYIGGLRQICNGTGQPPHATSADDGRRDPADQPIPLVPTQAGIDYLAMLREECPQRPDKPSAGQKRAKG